MVLEKEGVFGHVKLEEFHLELFPLDTHLLSLQMPDIFKSFYLVMHIHYVIHAVHQYFNIHEGYVPNIFAEVEFCNLKIQSFNILLKPVAKNKLFIAKYVI